jgi:hypothetical protein
MEDSDMKKRFLLALSLGGLAGLLFVCYAVVAPFSASVGELDGKGIICLGTAETGEVILPAWSGNKYSAYLFEGTSYRLQILIRDRAGNGQRMQIATTKSAGLYSAEAERVLLGGLAMDRRTLKIISPDCRYWQCEAYADVESLEAAFEEIRRAESEALKAYMSQNII